MASIDMDKVIPLGDFADADPEEREELRQLAEKARKYLSSYRWCGAIEHVFEGITVAGVVGGFLFEIKPTLPDVDEWLWVIVGDVPPAYLVTDDAPTPAIALSSYIAEMRAWVTAAEIGESVSDLIPVNVAPTRENAVLLRSRLDFLEHRVVPAPQPTDGRGRSRWP